MAKVVVATFDRFQDAQDVLRDLQERRFSREDTSIITNETLARNARAGTGEEVAIAMRDTAAGASTGALTGGVFGAGVGLIGGLAGLAIPGIGPIVAAGPIAATLAGAGIGAVAGGLIGVLVELGIPKEHAGYYAESVRRGGVLVTVQTSDAHSQEAADVMSRHGAVDIERRAEQWRQSGWTRHDLQGAAYTAEQTERDRVATAGGRTRSGNRASEPGLPKPHDWDENRSSFLTHHANTYGNATRYEDYEPAYQYGWESARMDRYRDRSWSAVEPELRRDWERRYPEGGAWDRFKAAVRNGWERASEAVEHVMPGNFDRDGR